MVGYDPAWPMRFAQESALIQQVIGPWVTGGIHHVGSTAVPGLTAKPIIDILVGVIDLETSRACIALLSPLHYRYAPYHDDQEHWLCKPDPSRRTHHLHLVPTGSQQFLDMLLFRDYLRSHLQVAAEYAALKRHLAEIHRQDREAYTEAKGSFIRATLSQARR